MLISANMAPEVYNKLRLIFRSEFITFWGVTRGNGSKPKMIKCDMEGGGKKYRFFESHTFSMALKVPEFSFEIILFL